MGFFAVVDELMFSMYLLLFWADVLVRFYVHAFVWWVLGNFVGVVVVNRAWLSCFLSEFKDFPLRHLHR